MHPSPSKIRTYGLLALALLLTSCVHFPTTALKQQPSLGIKTSSSRSAPIWLIAGELHSDFVVESAWLFSHGCRLPQSLKSYKYLCFGWGDEVAYTERWGLSDIPSALFWESKSIVQVVGFNTEVEKTFPDDTVIMSQTPSLHGHTLSNFLESTFTYQTPSSLEPITTRKAKWGHGYFIRSDYSYYFPRMCNQWVATALNKAGISEAKPFWRMSSQSLVRQLKRHKNQR